MLGFVRAAFRFAWAWVQKMIIEPLEDWVRHYLLSQCAADLHKDATQGSACRNRRLCPYQRLRRHGRSLRPSGAAGEVHNPSRSGAS